VCRKTGEEAPGVYALEARISNALRGPEREHSECREGEWMSRKANWTEELRDKQLVILDKRSHQSLVRHAVFAKRLCRLAD